MAEWLKAHAWKACLGETLTWVRIPLSPPEILQHSGFLGHYFSVLPDIDRRAVHPRDFPRPACRSRHGSLHRLEESTVLRRYFALFHRPASINLGVAPELSYTTATLHVGRACQGTAPQKTRSLFNQPDSRRGATG